MSRNKIPQEIDGLNNHNEHEVNSKTVKDPKIDSVNPLSAYSQKIVVARKDGSAIFSEENSPALVLARDIKSFEAMMLLGNNKPSDMEMRWYKNAKSNYAEKYNNGIMKDVFITSIDDAKQALYEASGSSLDEKFEEVRKEQTDAIKVLRVASAMTLLSDEGLETDSAKVYLDKKLDEFYKKYGEKPDVSFSSISEARDFMVTFTKDSAEERKNKSREKEYTSDLTREPVEGESNKGLEGVDIQELKEIAEKPLTEQELKDRKIVQTNTVKRFVPDDLLK